jgi:hypothetical protein
MYKVLNIFFWDKHRIKKVLSELMCFDLFRKKASFVGVNIVQLRISRGEMNNAN